VRANVLEPLDPLMPSPDVVASSFYIPRHRD
jgi:hypothetical protein